MMGAANELPDGLHAVPHGKLAAVVTSLEMFARAPLRAEPAHVPWTLERLAPDVVRYRALYHAVGDDYLWASRLEMRCEELRAILCDPCVEVYALRLDDRDEGLLELDFRVAAECELTFFGVTRNLVGTQAARWLMNRAIACAWSKPVARFWVHTCTLDHPSAVPFYTRSGFAPYRREIEILDDPRANGIVPPGAAAQQPLLRVASVR